MDEDVIIKGKNFDSEDEDDDIAHIRGNVIYKKIIPVLLQPKVIFPFKIQRPIISDPYLKKIFRQSFEEKAVFGYMYHPEDATQALPPEQHVGVSALVGGLDVAVDGSYVLKIVPLSRFYIKEYVNADPQDLTAKVSYYADQPEDEAVTKPLIEEYLQLTEQMFEVTGQYLGRKRTTAIDPNDDDIINFHLYTIISGYPKIDEKTKQFHLWNYKFSERLQTGIDILGDVLTIVNRVVKRMPPGFRNN